LTKSELETLERARMIENLKPVSIKIDHRIFDGYLYYNVEGQTKEFAIEDISESSIKEFQKAIRHLKLRRLERD